MSFTDHPHLCPIEFYYPNYFYSGFCEVYSKVSVVLTTLLCVMRCSSNLFALVLVRAHALCFPPRRLSYLNNSVLGYDPRFLLFLPLYLFNRFLTQHNLLREVSLGKIKTCRKNISLPFWSYIQY